MSEGRPRLRVGGLQLLTTMDWEGRLAAIVFLQGCPWRCHYCHNRELTPLTAPGMTPWSTVLDKLRPRRGFLDGVIFSGGEPTLQSALPDAISDVVQLGFQVALHTNGFDPAILQRLLEAGQISFVAMDVKAPFARYADITTVPHSGRAAEASVGAIVASKVPHEFRTTWHPALLSLDDLRSIAHSLAQLGAQSWFVQQFRREGCRSRGLRDSVLLPGELPAQLHQEFTGLFWRFGVREAGRPAGPQASGAAEPRTGDG